MTAIRPGTRVRLAFELRLVDGRVVDAAGEDEPLAFAIGDDTLMAGLETRLIGLSAGDERCFEIGAHEAVFGCPEADRIQDVARADFPDEVAPEVGNLIGFTLPNGEEVLGMIIANGDDRVTVDFNHPLIGRDFVFAVKVLEVACSANRKGS